MGRRPCTEGAKQPSKVHAGLRCLGDSSGNETDRPALASHKACQLAVFFGKLPSMEAEIDDKLRSNSSSVYAPSGVIKRFSFVDIDPS